MRWRSALGRDVVDTSSAKTIGTVEALVIEPETRRVTALVVAGADPSVLDFSALTAFGRDAVTVDGTAALRAPADDREKRVVDGELDPIGTQVLTEDGDLLGVVADIDVDREDGLVNSIVMADDQLAATRLLGVGSFAVVVRATDRSSEPDSAPGDLEELTKSELYEMAREREIDGRSTMSKRELMSALR